MIKVCWDPEEKLPSETRYGAHMDIGQYGDLSTLRWVENEFDPAPNMKHCEVTYGARSFWLFSSSPHSLPCLCHSRSLEGA